MSCVMCQMSHVRCHISGGTCNFFYDIVVELVVRGSVINWAYPVLFLDKLVELIGEGSVINKAYTV